MQTKSREAYSNRYDLSISPVMPKMREGPLPRIVQKYFGHSTCSLADWLAAKNGQE